MDAYCMTKKNHTNNYTESTRVFSRDITRNSKFYTIYETQAIS